MEGVSKDIGDPAFSLRLILIGKLIYNDIIEFWIILNGKMPTLFVERNNQYSVVCHTRVAEDCSENGGWCDSKEEAQDWVEEECWIFSGEGWLCLKCNAHFMRNLSQTRQTKVWMHCHQMDGTTIWRSALRHRKINTPPRKPSPTIASPPDPQRPAWSG